MLWIMMLQRLYTSPPSRLTKDLARISEYKFRIILDEERTMVTDKLVNIADILPL